MNVVFLSPHFPPNWFRFVVGLRNAGATTLGIADQPWETLRPELREALDDGASVGSIRRITSAFSYCAPPEFFAGNIRAKSKLEPHGCLGDLGWYCLRFALWAMDWQLPRRVSGHILAEQKSPLRSHSNSRLRVMEELQSGEQFAVLPAQLNAQRSLADGGKHLFGLEQDGYPLPQTKTVESGPGQDNGVKNTFIEFAQPGIDIAAKIGDVQIRT